MVSVEQSFGQLDVDTGTQTCRGHCYCPNNLWKHLIAEASLMSSRPCAPTLTSLSPLVSATDTIKKHTKLSVAITALANTATEATISLCLTLRGVRKQICFVSLCPCFWRAQPQPLLTLLSPISAGFLTSIFLMPTSILTFPLDSPLFTPYLLPAIHTHCYLLSSHIFCNASLNYIKKANSQNISCPLCARQHPLGLLSAC